MTTDFLQALGSRLAGRACLVGVGNAGAGDDGVGVRLAECLAAAMGTGGHGVDVAVAGMEPERHFCRLVDGGYDAVLFMDSVNFGGTAGSVALLDADEIMLRFPQISTHKIGLGTLAALIEANGRTRVSLLGIQPGSLKPGDALTGAVRQTLDALVKVFLERVPATQPEPIAT